MDSALEGLVHVLDAIGGEAEDAPEEQVQLPEHSEENVRDDADWRKVD